MIQEKRVLYKSITIFHNVKKATFELLLKKSSSLKTKRRNITVLMIKISTYRVFKIVLMKKWTMLILFMKWPNVIRTMLYLVKGVLMKMRLINGCWQRNFIWGFWMLKLILLHLMKLLKDRIRCYFLLLTSEVIILQIQGIEWLVISLKTMICGHHFQKLSIVTFII